MKITIDATSKELIDMGITAKDLQELVLEKVDAIKKGRNNIFWQVELAAEVKVSSLKKG